MKDLVEHVRTVHFTLLVVALILTAALQIEKRRPLERAAADAEAILLMAERWDQTREALRKELTRRVNDLVLPAKDRSGYWPSIEMHYTEAAFSGGSIVLEYEVQAPWIYVHREPPPPGTTDLRNWVTLNQFLWFGTM